MKRLHVAVIGGSGCAPIGKRCASMQWLWLAVLYILEHWGVRVYNPARVTATCNDKLLTTLALLHAGIPTTELT